MTSKFGKLHYRQVYCSNFMETSHARPTYHAFISYSQEADRLLAPEVQNALHHIDQPWHRLRKSGLRIFRDVTHMGKHNDLTEAIKEGIGNAENFILMASMKAKASPWVNKELAYFKERHQSERFSDIAKKIAIVVTDGEIRWDPITNDWDWEITNVLPDEMKHVFKSEPLWIDLRQVKKAKKLDIKGSIFNAGIIRLAAFILKKDPDQIDSQEIRKRKLLVRTTVAVIATLLVLLAATGYQTNRAWDESERATINEGRAIDESKRADGEAQRAKQQEKEAIKQAKVARSEAANAQRQKEIAVRESAEALRQKKIADERRRIADAATDSANLSRDKERIARQKESEARIRESEERKKTSLMNSLLVAENLALTSVREGSLTKALEAYDSFKLIDKASLRRYFNSDDRWYDKYPMIYDALKTFYGSNGPKIEHRSEIWSLGVLSNGSILAASLDGSVLIYDHAKQEGKALDLRIDLPRTITNIFLIPSRGWLAVTLDNHDLLFYKVSGDDLIMKRSISKQSGSEIVSVKEHNGRLLILNEGGELFLADLINSDVSDMRKLNVGNLNFIWADFLNDNSIVLYDGQYFRFFQTELLPRTIFQEGVSALFVDKGNQELYCGVSYIDAEQKVWNKIVRIGAEADRAIDFLPKGVPWTGNSRIEQLMVSYSGNKIVSIEANKQLKIFDLKERPMLLKSYALESKPRSLAISPTDELFVGMENGKVEYWPLHIQEIYARLTLLKNSKATVAIQK